MMVAAQRGGRRETAARQPAYVQRHTFGGDITWAAAALLLALSLPVGAAGAGLDDIREDGWYTWRAPAVEDAPSLCCMRWNRGNATPASCSLDHGRGNTMSFDSSSTTVPASDELQLYALVRNGDVERLRTLSSSCPVESEEPVIDLGVVDTGDSITWLARLVETRSDQDEDALAAIAMHAGRAAFRYVENVALEHADDELREDAVFWLGQVRIAESHDTLVKLMFEDPDEELREHAAFSLAQSTASDAADLLARQGREDRSPEVRSQAWFWLAQTDTAGSEEQIMQAIRSDPDDDVREEAVFALSQLPGDRAVNALLGVLNDRNLDREIREQALFWLADSDSDSALEAIERLLAER